ncbi:MAG: hypothetical protein R3F13_13590 [Prosthecobacter sp.]
MGAGLFVPQMSQAQEQAVAKIPELVLRLTEYDQEKQRVTEPFEKRRGALIEKYGSALDSALAESTKAGNLDEALAIKKELATAKAGSDPARNLVEASGGAVLARLRGIYTTEKTKIDAEEAIELQKAGRRLSTDLEALEAKLTRETRIDDAVAVRAVRDRIKDVGASAVVATSPTAGGAISEAMMQRMRDQGGRLRVAGMMMPNVPATTPDLEGLPADFVAVHAFRTAWIGIRKNGSSFIMGLNAERTTPRTEKTWRIEHVVRGYDAWCLSRDNIVHRLVNWENNRPSKLTKPVAIAAGHANCVLFNARGDTEFHGANPMQVIPGKALLETVKDAFSTKHLFLVVDESFKGRLWNMRTGTTVEEPILETSQVKQADGGEEHFIIQDQNGEVKIINAGKARDPVLQVPSGLGSVLRVKSGGHVAAVQNTDGTWTAWGESQFVPEEVKKVGVAPDLDVYSGEGADYVIWIDPKG